MKTQQIDTPATEQTTTAPAPWYSFEHRIEHAEGHELIVRHKRAHPGERHAVAFTSAGLNRILAQDGCHGIRMYFGLNPDGTRTLVLVGLDAEGYDMDLGEIADKGLICPPFCDIGGSLDI